MCSFSPLSFLSFLSTHTPIVSDSVCVSLFALTFRRCAPQWASHTSRPVQTDAVKHIGVKTHVLRLHVGYSSPDASLWSALTENLPLKCILRNNNGSVSHYAWPAANDANFFPPEPPLHRDSHQAPVDSDWSEPSPPHNSPRFHLYKKRVSGETGKRWRIPNEPPPCRYVQYLIAPSTHSFFRKRQYFTAPLKMQW